MTHGTRIGMRWLFSAASLVGAVAWTVKAETVANDVPAVWNTTPLKNGAYRESFENGAKDWMEFGSNRIVSNSEINQAFNGGTPLRDNTPARSNVWFDVHENALQIDTEGSIVTNRLTSGDNAYLPLSADKPVYIDMLVRFDPLSDGVDSALFDDAKMALFVVDTGHMVCKSQEGFFTNDVVMNTNEWNRITIKMQEQTFQVFRNDALVSFNGRDTFTVVSGAGDSDKLTQTSFCGTGHLDDLYVSFGSPTYAVPGATKPAAVKLPDTDLPVVQQTLVNKWFADNNTVLTEEAMGSKVVDETKALKAYLLNAPTEFANAENHEVSYSMGISSIDVLSTTAIRVRVSLQVAGSGKTAAINGVLRLEGKRNAADSYEKLTTSSFTGASFVNGIAEFDFTVPEGFHIFNPIITME